MSVIVGQRKEESPMLTPPDVRLHPVLFSIRIRTPLAIRSNGFLSLQEMQKRRSGGSVRNPRRAAAKAFRRGELTSSRKFKRRSPSSSSSV